MTNAWTKGPWKVFTAKQGHQVIGIGEVNGDGIADCGFGVWRGGDAEALANARLIAAAPDMAEALEKAEVLLADELDSLEGGYTILATNHPERGQLSAEGKELVAPYNEALSLIRAALAKARGAP